MKKLCIIRHAKAVDGTFGLPDFDRYLMAKGRFDAERLRRRLFETGFKPDIIISSSARRACETAEIFAGAWEILPADIILVDALYEAGSGEAVLQVVREHARGKAAIVVGHDPVFTDAVQQLCPKFDDNMPTCAVAVCELRSRNWDDIVSGSGELVHWDSPKSITTPEHDLQGYDTEVKKLTKSAYRKTKDELQIRLGQLQREAKKQGVPVAVILEGWHGAGKGTLLNKVLLALDPRGFTLHQTQAPTEEERYRPFLWPFWCRTPGAGEIVIFDQAWYSRLLTEQMSGRIEKREWKEHVEAINVFERQLTVDGTLIVKIFLHITEDEQKERFDRLEADKLTAWRVTDADWEQHKEYDEYRAAVEELLNSTDSVVAPWTVIAARDRRHARVQTLHALVDALEERLAVAPEVDMPPRVFAPLRVSRLDAVDLQQSLDKDSYREQLEHWQERLREVGLKLYMQRLPVVIAYEGWDAAGKGGNIRRVAAALDPRGYEVIPIAAPNDIERRHHYMWRFWTQMPKAGHLGIFDRSWYGRVMVERVEGFCSDAAWQRAFQEINEMEAHIASQAAVIFKFWLHIDADEQLTRFEARQSDPNKDWKITDEDWRNREKWDDYKAVVDEMLVRTHTSYAPWTVVPGTCKYFARTYVLQTLVERLEALL